MASFIIEYEDNGNIKNTLVFDGALYTYTMVQHEDDSGATSNAKSFEYQVQERFPDLYPEEVLDLLSEVCYYTNSDELQEIIIELSHYE